MCGIVYKHNYNGTPVNNDIMQQFDKQRQRGVEGFGVFDGQYMNIIKSTKEDAILKWLVKYASSMILFHHRIPTSTENIKRAAHPFSTGDFFGKNQYVLVHNGIIYNAKELQKEHEALGIQYKSMLIDGKFNDSEALLWDMALVLEGRQLLPKTRGDMAFICMKSKKGQLKRMYFGKNGRPLKMFRDKTTFELSSEGRGEDIQTNELYTWDFRRKILKCRSMKFDVGFQSTYDPNYTTRPGSIPRRVETSDNACFPYTDDHAIYTDDDAYAEYWESREAFNPIYDDENQQRLGRKIAQALLQSGLSEQQIIDLNPTEVTKSPAGLLIPGKPAALLGEVVAKKYSKYFTGMDKDELIQHSDEFGPDDGEVIKVSMSYLDNVGGNFEEAYNLVETVYAELMDNDGDNIDIMYKQLMLEKVMQFLNCDPEYENEKSVSSMWRSLCQQQTLAT